MNAMTRPMLAELGRLWDELERDDSRCIVVTGAGERAFSVGADVSGDLSAGPGDGAHGQPRAAEDRHLHESRSSPR